MILKNNVMKVLFNSKFLKHNSYSNSEGSYRIEKFAEKYENSDVNGEEFITLVHTNEYKQKIKQSCLNNDTLAEVSLSPESYEAAVSAVGLTVEASKHGDFAVVRPPGHHAGRERAAGFCFFNNIAIATQRLVNEGKRVFIFDFDGHHGDGTQSIFYDSDQVLFCSIHQLWAYPYTGFPEERGEGKGKGTTLNLPLISGAGDMEFYGQLNKAISAGKEFKPDVVAVSAGFDAYVDDSILSLKYSLKGYYECGLRLRRAFPNIFAVLEGGYHSDVMDCVEAFIEGVNIGSRPRKNLYNTDMSVG